MYPDEARQIMLKHMISFSDLARLSAMTELAIRKRITQGRQRIPDQLAAILRRLAYDRTKET